METILVLTHVDESGEALTKASLEAVTAGIELSRRLASPLAIGMIGRDVEAAAASVAATGARLLAVSGNYFAQPRYATDAAACEDLCRGAGCHRARPREFPLYACRGRRGPSTRRLHRHTHHRTWRCGFD